MLLGWRGFSYKLTEYSLDMRQTLMNSNMVSEPSCSLGLNSLCSTSSWSSLSLTLKLFLMSCVARIQNMSSREVRWSMFFKIQDAIFKCFFKSMTLPLISSLFKVWMKDWNMLLPAWGREKRLFLHLEITLKKKKKQKISEKCFWTDSWVIWFWKMF